MKDIKNRLEIGYVMSVYSSRETLHEQMHNDITTLLDKNDELVDMLKECRDLLLMCSLLDKSDHCNTLVSKVDKKMGW